MTFAAGALHGLSAAEEHLFSSSVMNIWRKTTSSTYQNCVDQQVDQLSNAEVLLKYDLMAPLTILKLMRLSLFIRVASGHNSLVKAAIVAASGSQKGWIDEVQRNFLWLKRVDRACTTSFLDEVSHLYDWVPLVKLRPQWWKKKVKEICQSPFANAVAAEDSIRLLPASACVADVYRCSECPCVFSSWQKTRLHEFKVHGIGIEARKYIDGSHSCPACLSRFRTRTQAVRHLHNAASQRRQCFLFEWYCDELPPDVVIALDAAETARLKHLKLTSSFTTCNVGKLSPFQGPLLYPFRECRKAKTTPTILS